MARNLVRSLDTLLRRSYGVFEFSDDPDCVLRLQLVFNPHRLYISSQEVLPGEPVLFIHLWNERLLRIPKAGPDIAWAKKMQRAFVHSLQLVAEYLVQNPDLAEVRAVGGVTALIHYGTHSGGARLMQRLGFTVIPYEGPLQRFGEFWENFYSWLLILTFNPASIRHRRLLALHRYEIWMLAGGFIARFG